MLQGTQERKGARYSWSILGPLALCCALGAGTASAVPYSSVKVDLPRCDPLYGRVIDEIGNAPSFPADERIDSASEPTSQIVCDDPNIEPNDPTIPDYFVEILNLTGRDIGDKVYGLAFVADADYAYRNYDGSVSGGLAMEIDRKGINRPLLFESINDDGIFQNGERWIFVVEDWRLASGAPALLPPHIFTSCLPGDTDPCTSGQVGAESVGDPRGSTASIVRNRIPEPATLALVGLGLAGLAASRRRKQS